MTNSIDDGGDRPQPVRSEAHTIAPESSGLITNLVFALDTGGAFGSTWAVGRTALSVLGPVALGVLQYCDIDAILFLPAVTPSPRRYLRQGIGLAAVVGPLAFVMACTGVVPKSRPPDRKWWNIPYKSTPQQQLELYQGSRQQSGLTILGAIYGATLSILSHRRFPRSGVSHAWEAVGTAALGSSTVTLIHSPLMAVKSMWANGQRFMSPWKGAWREMKRWWMEEEEQRAKSKEERKGSEMAHAAKLLRREERERKAYWRKEQESSQQVHQLEPQRKKPKARRAKRRSMRRTAKRVLGRHDRGKKERCGKHTRKNSKWAPKRLNRQNGGGWGGKGSKSNK